jgi:hypothetical protein
LRNAPPFAGTLRAIVGRHLANNPPNLEKGIRDPQPIPPARLCLI